jgi:hypothetical protein
MYSEKTSPSATLSTTKPTLPDQGSNPGRHGGKPATDRLSYLKMTGEGIPSLCLPSGYDKFHKTLHHKFFAQLQMSGYVLYVNINFTEDSYLRMYNAV